MHDTGIKSPAGGITIKCYNQGTFPLSRNEFQNERTKHIDIKLNFSKENVKYGNFNFSYISSDQMTADVLTKFLPPLKQVYHKINMGIKPHNCGNQNEGECCH